MSALFRGTFGPSLIQQDRTYDADQKVYSIEELYEGSHDAILGMEVSAQSSGYFYRVSNDGPKWYIFLRIPNDPTTDPDRWEITTESQDRSIWQHPDVMEMVKAYDDGGVPIGPGVKTFKQEMEDEVGTRGSFDITSGNRKILHEHLKGEVLGWQMDFVVLRRHRKVPVAYATGLGRMTLTIGNLLYTTAELGVPASVAFQLPETPSEAEPHQTNFAWTWRRRSQSTVLVGEFVEQDVELVFAPWSLLFYQLAGETLVW